MEFATKVSNLEAPVWVGGRSYFVQGEYTQRYSRQEFYEKYYNDDNLKSKYVNDPKPRYSDNYYDKNNKLFQPADDYSDAKLKQILREKDYDFSDFIEEYHDNNYALNMFFYPKQIQQFLQLHGNK